MESNVEKNIRDFKEIPSLVRTSIMNLYFPQKLLDFYLLRKEFGQKEGSQIIMKK
jgi:hypothetical protein